VRPRYLTAFEHQPLPIGDSGTGTGLTSVEADRLLSIGESRPGFCERRYRSIRLAQYAGVVSLGDRVLEILPKIDELTPPEDCRGILLRLLKQSDRFPLYRHLPVGQSLRDARLLEVFISAFFDSVTEIVRGGLLRQYRECEEDLSVVRGRILTGRQFAMLSNRVDIIACRFDDLTADNIWNRLLKVALRSVRPWIASFELNRRWTELMAVFEEIPDTRIEMRVFDRLVFDRHAVRYRTGIEWARWILGTLSPAIRAGENTAPGLLFDMNALFQSAIASVLNRKIDLNSHIHLRSQEADRFLTKVVESGTAAFRLKPDLVFRRFHELRAIADTKWKRLKISESGHLLPDESDIYQMHAYAAAYGCDQLALIYPWHAGLTQSKETGFQLPGSDRSRSVVHVVCIDVSKDTFTAVRGQSFFEFGRTIVLGQSLG